MEFDNETEIFLPSIFGLVEDQVEWTYWNYIHLILLKFEPATITLDFAIAMPNAEHDQLPNMVRMGYRFRYKQHCKESWLSCKFQKPRLRMQC
ncbi:hypothetical protein MXB_4855, partial [Myxobolus squamalis]